MGELEKQIERDILIWLNKAGFFAWKNQSVGIYDTALRSYRKRNPFEIKGVSDIIAFIEGRTHFIEVKRPNEPLRDEQRVFQGICKERGIPYYRVESVKEIEEIYGTKKPSLAQ